MGPLSARLIGQVHEQGKPPQPATVEDFTPRPNFRRFVLLSAAVQGTIAVGGPSSGVHMLRDLGFGHTEDMAVLAVRVLGDVAWSGSSRASGDYLYDLKGGQAPGNHAGPQRHRGRDVPGGPAG
jgi:hypothetical protein